MGCLPTKLLSLNTVKISNVASISNNIDSKGLRLSSLWQGEGDNFFGTNPDVVDLGSIALWAYLVYSKELLAIMQNMIAAERYYEYVYFDNELLIVSASLATQLVSLGRYVHLLIYI